MYQIIFKALCLLSQDDAEKAHLLAIRILRFFEEHPFLLSLLERFAGDSPAQAVTVCGIRFPNQVGLAAGFDKHAEALVALQALGFGFLEVGTVLPRIQAGKSRPRLFRLTEYQSIINRMGFNSHGARIVAQRLSRYQELQKLRVPIGLSLGKMADTPNEYADEDYSEVAETLAPYGDYIVGNVSSPNTAGLRDLQEKARLLNLARTIVRRDREYRSRLNLMPRPLFMKVAPDDMVSDDILKDTVEAIEESGASGIIIGNTTKRRAPYMKYHPHVHEEGGLSGPYLRDEMLRLVSATRGFNPKLPIIAVGGIEAPEDGIAAVDAGASLIQIYTAVVFEGPSIIHGLRTALS